MNKIEAKFWSRVSKGGPDECWNWTGYINQSGHGRFCNGERNELVHRYSFRLAFGTIRKNRLIHHKCENPACVNPKHLQSVVPRQHIVKLSPKAVAFKNARKTHCSKGHPLSGDNLQIRRGKKFGRQCKACARIKYLNNREECIARAVARKKLMRAHIRNDERIKSARKRGINLKIIEVLVSPVGQVTVQTKGYAGKACTDATKELELALGTVTADVKSGEYYQAAPAAGLSARQ